MNARAKVAGVIALLLAGLGVCTALVYDTATAKTEIQMGTVVDKEHIPGRTSLWTDGDGHLHTTYHPPRWTLIVSVDSGRHDVSVRAGRYEATPVGSEVPIRIRRGRWLTLYDMGIGEQ